MYLRKVRGRIAYRPGVFQIRLRLHYTWWFALILVAFMMAANVSLTVSMWSRLAWGVGIFFVFLMLVIARQFVVNLFAVRRGAALRRVTLYAIGGSLGIAREFTSPATEMALGLAGLAVSAFGILLLYGAYVILVLTNVNAVADLALQLLYLMVLFALFHCLPGFPLDGGRILRGLLWRHYGDYDRATMIAGRAGQIVGVLVIVGGIGLVPAGQAWFIVAGVIIAGVALFIAAIDVVRTTRLRSNLRDTDVAKVTMARVVPSVDRAVTVRALVRDYVVPNGNFFFVVTGEDSGVVSCVTLGDMMAVPKRYWDTRTAESIGTATGRFYQARAGQPAADVLEQMIQMDIPMMPVLLDETVLGLVDRDELLHLTRIRGSLQLLADPREGVSRFTAWWLRLRTEAHQ